MRTAAVAREPETCHVGGRGETSLTEYADSIGAAAYPDGVAMIENADIDAVSMCVSPKWREPLVVAAAKRQLPVIMEKPMAWDTAQGEKLARIATDAGIQVENLHSGPSSMRTQPSPGTKRNPSTVVL